jgi:hypothetical protein
MALGIGVLLMAALGAAVVQDGSSSRAYVGHEKDTDMKIFIRRYPGTAGSRLDDCQTCHRGGALGTDAEREFSPCSYCHLLEYPNARYKTGVPRSTADTLNAFGVDYAKAGRSLAALTAIADQDSDGDGSTNAAEIAALRYPGDPASRPGQPLAPAVILSWDELMKLPAHRQFMLMNATKEPTDDYVNYTGVRVVAVLQASGVDLRGAEGITVFAPDGYSIDYSIDDVTRAFPEGYYYEGPRAIKDPERTFVKYSSLIPAGFQDGQKIPDALWLLLAYERDTKPLDGSYYEKGTGRLAGEGPFRLVKPQKDLLGDPSKPGRPDRSLRAKAFVDGWDFNSAIDHNAGACVRGACVIRVNPMPAGFEEFDWKNGWPLIQKKQIVIFGRGIAPKRLGERRPKP